MLGHIHANSRDRHRKGGTRFRLYPQYDEGLPAEIVVVSPPAGSLGPGPADPRMYVADAIDKRQPYAPPDPSPPYRGAMWPPARPDPAGHFDAIPETAPQFRAAHLFGTVRLVLDIWEAASGETVHWWHPGAPARVELIPSVDWQNAQSGPGFLETGFWPGTGGAPQPFCLNFDVIAHETGHAILFGALGVPQSAAPSAQFLAFHEAFGDLVALLGALEFASVRRRLFAQTFGNLYVLNLVNRLAETAPTQQIRIASNAVTMCDVAGLRPRPDGSWDDPLGLGRNAHDLSLPMLGAMFDVLVLLYQQGLVARRLIRPVADARGWSPQAAAQAFARVRWEHAQALARFADGFDAALAVARDAVLGFLVHAIRGLDAEDLRFEQVAARVLEAAMLGGYGALFQPLRNIFVTRGIDPAPCMVMAPRRPRHLPILPHPGCACHHPARLRAARAMMPHRHRSA